MEKITRKITKIILITFAIATLFGIANNVNATVRLNGTQTLNQGEQAQFIKVDIGKIGFGNINPDSGMTSIIAKVFGVVQYVCVAAAVIVMVVSGVKYAAAAPDQKADIKKQAIALIIGAVIVFSISTILRIIAGITRNSIN